LTIIIIIKNDDPFKKLFKSLDNYTVKSGVQEY